MRLKILFLFIFLSFFASCGGGNDEESPVPPPPISGDTPTENISQDSLNRIQNGIFIKYNGASKPTITNAYEKVNIETSGANVVVNSEDESTEYNFIVSGATSGGSLKIYGEHKIGLYLNGASITNSNGPAINIQNGKKISEISLYIIGQKSSLTGSAIYEEGEDAEDAKGAFFGEGKLLVSGGSTLEVSAKIGHAIRIDNYFEMNGGCIVVKESDRDGIHANSDITINGGLIYISSNGDAIQSGHESVFVKGGKIKARTSGIKSHGISSENETKISGNAELDLEVLGNGSKGIKSTGLVDIQGGTTKIRTSGTMHTNDDNDTNRPSGIKTDGNMTISSGDLDIESTGKDSRGIKTDGTFTLSGGNVKIVANHNAIKSDGRLQISGGDVYLESKTKNAVNGNPYSKMTNNITEKDKTDADGF